MARDRKPNKGSKGSNNKVAEALNAETKVSNADPAAAASTEATALQPEEIWDVTRLIPKSELVVCRVEGCNHKAVVTWASNLKPDDPWDMCVECQESDFGGWPEGIEPPPDIDETTAPALSEEKKDEIQSEKITEPTPVFVSPPSKGASLGEGQPNAVVEVNDEMTKDDGNIEVWHLKRVLPIEAITKECPVKCSTEECSLPACCVWVSNQAPTTNWYSCIDCQLNDFQGWPPLDEIPLSSMTAEHKDAMASKCSKSRAPAMPHFPQTTANLTPLPNSSCDSAQAKVGMHVTPSPAVVAPAKPSADTLAARKKWQDELLALNGPDTRLVLGKPEAKKLIFDVLHDAFRPMAMPDIHKALRAVVPAPVLKLCLQDMTLDNGDAKDQFCDSDDEEEGERPKKPVKSDRMSSNDPFAGALAFKVGKGVNSILYYVDYTKLQNNGNGLDVDQRNELVSKLAKAQVEETTLKARLQEVLAETAQLLAEPTNEQLIPQLEVEEPVVASLREKLDAARLLKVNEKHKKRTQKRIENMVAHWRKRKRLCMDFLINMEESTEGVISAKKCLSGNGQIDIDSDETVLAGTLAFRKKKSALGSKTGQSARKKPRLSKSTAGDNEKRANGVAETSGVGADDAFVAVKLDSQGSVCRVYLDDETTW